MADAAKVHVPTEPASAPSETPKKRRGRRRLYTKRAKIGRRSRDKGAEGEREIVRMAEELGFASAERSAPMQAGRNKGGECDVREVGRLRIESKRYKRTPVNRFAREVLSEERPGFVSVLVYRDDRQPEPYAVLTLRELLKLERQAFGNGPGCHGDGAKECGGCGSGGCSGIVALGGGK